MAMMTKVIATMPPTMAIMAAPAPTAKRIRMRLMAGTIIGSAAAEDQAKQDTDTERDAGRRQWLLFDFLGNLIGAGLGLGPHAVAGGACAICRFGAGGTSGLLQKRSEARELRAQLLEFTRQRVDISFRFGHVRVRHDQSSEQRIVRQNKVKIGYGGATC